MFKMLLVDKDDTIKRPVIFTPWSLIHFVVGWIAYVVLKMIKPNCSNSRLALVWLIIHTVYETKDCFVSYGMGISETNSLYNSVGDTISTMAGFGVGILVGKANINMLIVGFIAIASLQVYFDKIKVG